jgi:hypothetical protein
MVTKVPHEPMAAVITYVRQISVEISNRLTNLLQMLENLKGRHHLEDLGVDGRK